MYILICLTDIKSSTRVTDLFLLQLNNLTVWKTAREFWASIHEGYNQQNYLQASILFMLFLNENNFNYFE